MNTMKAISAAVVLSATIAAPVFAQEYRPYARAPFQNGPEAFYRPHDQVPGDYLRPLNTEEFHNLQNFGVTGRDPSRVGGKSPSLNPPGG
jgi:hypothetical protein